LTDRYAEQDKKTDTGYVEISESSSTEKKDHDHFSAADRSTFLFGSGGIMAFVFFYPL
jgi:hypothetical protein